MGTKVGIPRALFYHYYYPLWKKFFENLGAEVVVSPPTNKRILDLGIKHAVDEACLPIKCYYGHVQALKNCVDFLFVPRMVSVEKKAFMCPKSMGLPDMLRSNVTGLPRLIDTTVNLNDSKRSLKRAVKETGSFLCGSSKEIKWAWKDACSYYERFLDLTSSGLFPDEAIEHLEAENQEAELNGGSSDNSVNIALLGRGYILYDDYLSMGIVANLKRMGVRVVTPDILPFEVTEDRAGRLPKRMFWTLGKRLLGGALHYLDSPEVDGIIYVAAFGCGPDSMIADLSERFARRNGSTPFQLITVDEHSGGAGLMTRIEAFVDMLKWRGIS